VKMYLGMGQDGDPNNLPEHKFSRMRDENPSYIKSLSFGYDRERPIDFNAPVWYAQKFSKHEIEELMRRKMI
jgi:hypothetical protein